MNNTLFEDMEADSTRDLASSIEKLDQQDLTTVSGMCTAILNKEDEIAALEQRLKDEKKALLKMTDEDLPTMLQEIGLSSMKLDDGSEVTVKPTYGATILVENKQAAFQWLRENGYGDLVKNTVTCTFGMGEDEKAAAFAREAQAKGYAPEQKENVHPQTQRAFVKERMESGDEFPTELFGAWTGFKAIIKRSK